MIVDLSTKLFIVRETDGGYDLPDYCPIVMNIPCFKKLYLKDTSNKKLFYAQQLAFMWFYLYPGSPFKNSEDRYADSKYAVFEDAPFEISPELKECMDYYEKYNISPEARYERTVLEMVTSLSEKREEILKDNLLSEKYIQSLTLEISKTKDVYRQTELFSMIDDRKKAMNNRKKEEIEIMSKLNEIVKQLPEIRLRAEEAQLKMAEATNSNVVESFMDDFLIEEEGL